MDSWFPPPSLSGTAGGSGALTIADAETLAIAASPSLAEGAARVRAARCEGVQRGLPPNPSAGYLASEVGAEGAAGQQGAFVSQKFVRGGKLGFAQTVADKEANRLEQELDVERLRLLTDTRTAFYDVYLTQLEVNLAGELADVGRKAVATSAQLRDAGEGRRTDSLQAEIEYQRAVAARRSAEQRLVASWRRLAAITGLPPAPPRTIEAAPEDLSAALDGEADCDDLTALSPQIAARLAAIERAECELAYQRSLAVQDVTAQFSLQYDDAVDDVLAGVQVGAPIPIWNRNQGGIGRARAELSASRHRLDAAQQSLRRRFAAVQGRYRAARVRVDALRREVLPRAQESLSLAAEGYEAGEIGFLDLLTVQRTYFQVSLESLDAYRDLNVSLQLLRGCLLDGSGEQSED